MSLQNSSAAMYSSSNLSFIGDPRWNSGFINNSDGVDLNSGATWEITTTDEAVGGIYDGNTFGHSRITIVPSPSEQWAQPAPYYGPVVPMRLPELTDEQRQQLMREWMEHMERTRNTPPAVAAPAEPEPNAAVDTTDSFRPKRKLDLD